MTTPAAENDPAILTAVEAARVTARAVGQASDVGRGISYMVMAVGLFTLMDVSVKWLSPDYPTMQIIFFRSVFAFIPLGIFIMRTGSLASLATKRPVGHLMRSFIGLAAMGCFFYAFAHMPLANAVAIGFAAPLFITALSVPLLGEAVGARRWSAVGVGFIGVIIMVRPDAGIFDDVAMIALSGAIFMSLAMIYVRKLSKTETSAAIVFYFSLSASLVSAIFMPSQWVAPDLDDWVLLILVGLVGGVAQIFMTNAFRNAPVAVIVPFEYTAMIWAAILGFFVWGEIPGSNVWVGVAIVTVSGIYIVRRESKLGMRRGVARPHMTKR